MFQKKITKVMFTSFVTLCVLLSLLSTGSKRVYALDCGDVRELTKMYTKNHLTHKSFSADIARRTVNHLISSWDSTKSYFLESDIDRFYDTYGKNLGALIGKSDCSLAFDIADTYIKRFQEALESIYAIIDSDHDFSLPETMMIDLDFFEFARTIKEQQERWRKRIKYQHLQLIDELTDKEIQQRLKKRYALIKKRHDELELSDIYSQLMKAYANALDPHSAYISPADLESFQMNMRLSLEGIGITVSSEDGFTRVIQVLAGGAADKQGELKSGDKIIAVAQGNRKFVDVIDSDLSDVVQLIRGKRGTLVKLRILRKSGGEVMKKTVAIIREKIALKSQQVNEFTYEINDVLKERTIKIGVVVVPSFYTELLGGSSKKRTDSYKNVTHDVEIAVKNLMKEQVEGIVIDLRNNSGGSLDESVKMSGLFIPDALVVQTKNVTIEQSQARDGKLIYDGPLVVLVDLLSASASEIFAGAMKDHNRAIIVGGDHTFGKGTVQRHILLGEDKGAINVTISKFYTPNGQSTQLKGVSSHIAFPSLLEEYKIGEKFNEHPLEWDAIPSGKLLKLPYVNSTYITKLKDYSNLRRQENQDFIKLSKDIKRTRQNKKEGTPVSLQLTDDDLEQMSSQDDQDESQDSEPNTFGEVKASDLETDFYLRESIFIASDYAYLLRREVPSKGYQIMPKESADNNSLTQFHDNCLIQHSVSTLIGC